MHELAVYKKFLLQMVHQVRWSMMNVQYTSFGEAILVFIEQKPFFNLGERPNLLANTV